MLLQFTAVQSKILAQMFQTTNQQFKQGTSFLDQDLVQLYSFTYTYLLEVGRGARCDIVVSENHLLRDSASHANIHLREHLKNVQTKEKKPHEQKHA